MKRWKQYILKLFQRKKPMNMTICELPVKYSHTITPFLDLVEHAKKIQNQENRQLVITPSKTPLDKEILKLLFDEHLSQTERR